MKRLPKVALIGTGGTISTRSRLGSLDTVDYMSNGETLEIHDVLAAIPEVSRLAEILPISFRAISSTAMDFTIWRELVALLRNLEAQHADLDGIVILHGTATLEETAYFLHLTARLRVPIVLTGAQRPLSALSSDSAANLCAAIRVASAPLARDLGVLVCLNEEVHAARDVTKFSTNRLHSFQSPSFGPLGQVDGDGVYFYRRPIREDSHGMPLDVMMVSSLPPVEVTYSVSGDNGGLIRAAVDLGAEGLVIAALAGGRLSRLQVETVRDCIARGVVVVMSTRAGTGRAILDGPTRDIGCISADNLNPQKAKILTALALAARCDQADLADWFAKF